MTLKVFLYLAISIHASVHANQPRNEFSDVQIKNIFHRDSNDLPDYKTATLKTSKSHRSKRELRPVEFIVDGKKIQLNLTPSKYNSLPGDTPVWTVETDHRKPSGHTYNRVDQKQVEYDGILYEDKKHMTTLFAYCKDQHIFYDGLLGESYLTKVIRSVPEAWWRTPENESDDHVTYDVKQNKSETETIEDSADTSGVDKLDETLDVLYPKLLVIIEYNYFKALAEDISETIKYVATFWNAVNLKYSKLTSPKINVVISGVIIAKDDTALQYIYAARNHSDMATLNHTKMLMRGSTYFREEFKIEVNFKNYDSTMTMTNLYAGAAGVLTGKICSPSLNVGFVKDDTSFSGVFSATHELGHLLNLPHDGKGRAKECRAFPQQKVSTMMAPYMIHAKTFYWSKCSEKILRDFAMMKEAECMKYPNRT